MDGYFYSMVSNKEYHMAVTENNFNKTSMSRCDDPTTGSGNVYSTNLRSLLADNRGRNRDWYSRDSQTTFFGSHSILNRSISVYDGPISTGTIVACCNVEQYDTKDDYLYMWKMMLGTEPAVTKDDLE